MPLPETTPYVEIAVRETDDMGMLLGFFAGTAYRAERTAEDRLLLTAPAGVGGSAARRGVEAYLRLAARLSPGLDATILD